MSIRVETLLVRRPALTLAELDYDDAWSEDEVDALPQAGTSRPLDDKTPGDGVSRVRQLEAELERVRAEASSLRNLLQSSLEDGEADDVLNGSSVPALVNGKGKGKAKARGMRDDESHYFDSYAENGQFHSLRLAGVALPASVCD